jgi:hopanoid C-3 methylase
MKILLIRPRPHKETIGLQHVMICEPLELEYICSNIDNPSADVEIIDMIIEKKPLSYFIEKHNPDLVGLSGYISHVNIIKEYAAVIKKVRPKCKVAVGGVHAEVLPQDFEDENIDYIIEANGLRTFNNIVNSLMNREERLNPPEGVYCPGKVNLKDSSFEYNFPDRSKVARYRSKYYYMFHNPCALIKTSFGCPYSCTFCFCRQITEGRYFTRTIDSVIQELKGIPEKEIYIVDDDFLASKDRILEFCHKLRSNNIDKRFLVYGRADFVYNNEDVIKTFKECGLRAVIVGLESCRDEDLDKYNKRTDAKVNEGAIRILQSLDVEVYGTMILDMDFSKEDFKRLYRWLKKMELIFVNLQPFTPLKGTALYEEYKEQLIIPREEFERWDLAHLVLKPEKMSIRRYYFEIIMLYYKITMQPKNIIKLLKKYGLRENVKMLFGSSRVTWQYFFKVLKGR